MGMGVYVLLERRAHYVLAAEVQPDVERVLQCPVTSRLNAVIVPVTPSTIKAKLSCEEVQALGGQPAARISEATATD